MKRLLIVLAFLLIPTRVFSAGEIFKIETSGTEYCGDLDSTRFNAGNNVDFWLQLISDTEILVSLTPNFDPELSFPVFGHTYLTSNSQAAFIGGAAGGDQFVTIQGTAKFDRRTGEVSSLSGTFIQNGVPFEDCFSSGKFNSQRIS